MKNTVFNDIIKQQKHCYFISPHFDDAMLSAGGLIEYLADKTPVTVINVFTKGGQKPYSLSARAFLKKCAANTADELYKEREREDVQAFEDLNVEIIKLSFTDALWRTKNAPLYIEKKLSFLIPELLYVYPTYWHVVRKKLSKFDTKLSENVKKSIAKNVDKDSVVFCPGAIGNHIDHIIVYEACKALFPQCIYWSDFPYINQSNQSRKDILFKFNTQKKIKRIKRYKTQYSAMFPKGISTVPEERYFIHNNE